MPRPTVPLVGRAAEFGVLLNAVLGARKSAAAAVVLGGDAGVGKTRLLAELVATANDAGVCTLIGHCVDLGDAPPPYLPFSEAFTRLSAERPELVDGLFTRFPALAPLVPGRAGAEPRVRDDRVDRGELFDSVLGGLGWLATEHPVALLVEDVHWADQATRDLLGFLFTRLDFERVAVVASYRSDDLHRRHPLRRTLAEWARLPSVTRIHLDPLPADDIRTLVRAMDADTIDEMDLEGIVTRADGNAFFAEELLAAALACDDAQQLPWQLADLLLVRLDRLSDDAREVVRAAAVGGRRVAHQTLEAVMGVPARQLDDALREAIDSHVLQLTSSGKGYTFRHALLAEAIYDDLLPGERVRLHAAYAAVFAEMSSRRAAELARHALASHDLETAFRASVAAGDDAMTLAAPREALAHYETALELYQRVSEPHLERPQLILAAVDAADAAGQTLRGVKLAAAALAELPADATALDRGTILYAAAKAALGGEIGEDVLEHTTEAVHLVPAEPLTPFRARVLALHARVAVIFGREVDAVRSANEALEIAEAVGSKLAATEARGSLATIDRRTRAPEEAATALESVIEQAAAVGDAATEVRSRHSLAGLWFEQCDLSRAEAGYLAAHQRAVDTGRRWDIYGLMSRSMAAYVQYHRGEWDAALRTIDTTGEHPTAIGDGVLRGVRMLITVGRGDGDSVLADFAQLRQYFRREGQIPLNAGFAALEVYEQRGDVEGALGLIDELVELLGELWLNPWFLARIQMSAVGLSALATAAATAPQTQHAELAAAGSQLASDGRTSAEKGLPGARQLGREGRAWLARLDAEAARLRWLTGVDAPSADELVGAWERTVAEFDYGNVVQVARSRARLAAALRATGRAADAGEQAELARAAASSMGATPLLDQLRTLGAATRRPADAERGGLSALTDRERDVLAQLVEGRTNRQIAAKLYISEKTASVHVSNILGKLGVRSRAEAAVLARKAEPSV